MQWIILNPSSAFQQRTEIKDFCDRLIRCWMWDLPVLIWQVSGSLNLWANYLYLYMPDFFFFPHLLCLSTDWNFAIGSRTGLLGGSSNHTQTKKKLRSLSGCSNEPNSHMHVNHSQSSSVWFLELLFSGKLNLVFKKDVFFMTSYVMEGDTWDHLAHPSSLCRNPSSRIPDRSQSKFLLNMLNEQKITLSFGHHFYSWTWIFFSTFNQNLSSIT